jgi:light-regulated signal transduction histidine kinase (bacteriophytochrome)
LRERSKNTPIIFVTAHETGEESIVQAYSVGAVDFLSKPIIPEILIYKVEVFINLFNHSRMMAAQTKALEESNLELAEQLRTIQRLNTRLEDANEQLEAFVYSTTHDLRAPLRIIQMFGKKLLDKSIPEPGTEARDWLERMMNKAGAMSQLIDDLLNLAYASQTELTRQEVNLAQIAGSILEELVNLSPNRHVEIRIQPTLMAVADRDLIKIALDNLLRNAWKFTSKCEQAMIEVSAIKHRDQWVYLIRDNGVGFDMEQGDKLFKPFQRLHNRNEFEGTGIGLTIVRRIIERHGGSIWFEAAVNHGVTFYFTLGNP